jgi:hypothetical protein
MTPYRVTYYGHTIHFATLEEGLAYAQGCTSFSATMGRGNSSKAALLVGPSIRLRVRAACKREKEVN